MFLIDIFVCLFDQRFGFFVHLISTKKEGYVRNNFNPLCRRNAALIDWVDAITIFSMYGDIHTISDFNIIIDLLVFMFFAQERFWNDKLKLVAGYFTAHIHYNTFNNLLSPLYFWDVSFDFHFPFHNFSPSKYAMNAKV